MIVSIIVLFAAVLIFIRTLYLTETQTWAHALTLTSVAAFAAFAAAEAVGVVVGELSRVSMLSVLACPTLAIYLWLPKPGWLKHDHSRTS